jgi:hypothetical protein
MHIHCQVWGKSQFLCAESDAIMESHTSNATTVKLDDPSIQDDLELPPLSEMSLLSARGTV